MQFNNRSDRSELWIPKFTNMTTIAGGNAKKINSEGGQMMTLQEIGRVQELDRRERGTRDTREN